MAPASVSAVLFAKDLKKVADFYAAALGMIAGVSDEHHSALNCRGLDLIVHQIPKQLAEAIDLQQPPRRRADGAIRLSFPVINVDEARRVAIECGRQIDAIAPDWADPNSNIFLGHDPEGNVFKVSQQAG